MSDEVVGKRFAGPGGVYLCTEYDPAIGFWMQNVTDITDRRNVSERAIHRTFHLVRMSYGAWRHLELYAKLGRTPTTEELDREEILHWMTNPTLLKNGLIEPAGTLTPRGQQAVGTQDHAYYSTILEF